MILCKINVEATASSNNENALSKAIRYFIVSPVLIILFPPSNSIDCSHLVVLENEERLTESECEVRC